MARLFGFIANRVDEKSRVLRLHRDELLVQRNDEPPVGWGLGFYQYGEVLLRRRPVDQRPIIDLTELIEDVTTDLLIGHVRRATVSVYRTENTHPFRYRNWLFAQTGTISGFEKLLPRLRKSLPEFLLRDVRGETDSEVFFHVLLSFLHDAGHLAVERPPASGITDALRASVQLVDQLSLEEGHPANEGDTLLTEGEHLVALHRGGVMAYRTLSGQELLDEVHGASSKEQFALANANAARFTLIGAEFGTAPGGWVVVPNRSLVTLTRSGGVTVTPL